MSENKTLDRAAILAAQDLPVKKIPVPEWKGSAYIRRLTAGERDAFDALVMERQGVGVRTALCLRSLCDASGQRLFKDEDAEMLAGKCSTALDRVYDAAAEFNALADDTKQDLEKNSGSGPVADSSSG
jgi:hypothetical protein